MDVSHIPEEDPVEVLEMRIKLKNNKADHQGSPTESKTQGSAGCFSASRTDLGHIDWPFSGASCVCCSIHLIRPATCASS